VSKRTDNIYTNIGHSQIDVVDICSDHHMVLCETTSLIVKKPEQFFPKKTIMKISMKVKDLKSFSQVGPIVKQIGVDREPRDAKPVFFKVTAKEATGDRQKYGFLSRPLNKKKVLQV